ncbi:hypothetical protein [Desulfospira joergensenii]|uniref:hypothetical protein n=1 Tax=Desulfospira joergensenii TaxID=53329 RepID=UPI0004191D6E|nr:hypothetical protein [Desulfospira joergensenii]
MENFNIRADADPSGFRARLANRFKIGDEKIDAVLSVAKSAADAYMVLRCGEISGKSSENAIEKYKSQKNKGWGSYGRSLGIKPGSKEFQDLKSGDDLYAGKGKARDKNKGKTKTKGKGKGKK